MSEIDIDELDALDIIEQMTTDGWLYRVTNSAMQKKQTVNILMLRGNAHHCLFGTDKKYSYQYSDGHQAESFTEAVRGAARKALARGW